MFTKIAFQRIPRLTRGFSSRRTGSSGSGTRGASEDTTSSTNQTSNSPNFGTSNQGGGNFSGTSNHNDSGASNQGSPASASKATSTSGTSQVSGSGANAMNTKSNPKTAGDDNAGGAFSNFFKNTFGSTAGSNPTSGTSTESSNPNRPSIPSHATDAPKYTNADVNVDHSKERLRNTSTTHTTRRSAKTEFTDYDRARQDLPFHNVSSRYAFLLWSIYKEEGVLDQLDADVEKFIKSVGSSQPLQKIFDDDSRITETNRQDEFQQYAKAGNFTNDKFRAFLQTLAENRRLSDLLSIFEAIPHVRDRLEHQQRHAVVTSARSLTDAERDSIKNTIRKTFNAKEVVIEEQIKPEIGGGYEIYYDGQYHLDNTQKSMISDLDAQVGTAIGTFAARDK